MTNLDGSLPLSAAVRRLVPTLGAAKVDDRSCAICFNPFPGRWIVDRKYTRGLTLVDGEMVFICCACSEERGCDMTSYDEPDFPWERRGQPKIELPRGPSPEELAEAEALASATGSEVEEELEPVLALDHVGVEDE